MLNDIHSGSLRLQNLLHVEYSISEAFCMVLNSGLNFVIRIISMMTCKGAEYFVYILLLLHNPARRERLACETTQEVRMRMAYGAAIAQPESSHVTYM